MEVRAWMKVGVNGVETTQIFGGRFWSRLRDEQGGIGEAMR